METYKEVLQFLHFHPQSSKQELAEGIGFTGSDASLKRLLSEGVRMGDIQAEGKARATRYSLSLQALLMMPLDLDTYFAKDIDEREIQQNYNFDLIPNQLPHVRIFTQEEEEKLTELHNEFLERIKGISANEYQKEMERLGIDLSWKSSQIEGNTYSLLETERLLKESQTAEGKTQEEARMLLNHKEALKFVLSQPDYLKELSIARIEDIHTILVQGLSVDKGLRHRRVGITGTNYHPLDNHFQIEEAVRDMCDLINRKASVFEKALLTLLLMSYIQPFVDGNKRTARIVSNALLMANDYCPLSFRTISPLDYKKAMLLFYEQNNLSAFKKIFISQVQFAVKEYF